VPPLVTVAPISSASYEPTPVSQLNVVATAVVAPESGGDPPRRGADLRSITLPASDYRAHRVPGLERLLQSSPCRSLSTASTVVFARRNRGTEDRRTESGVSCGELC